MRLKIHHSTQYRYGIPPNSLIEVLRLTPRNTASQSVRDWRLEASVDVALRRFGDAFGNINHTFTVERPPQEITITATGTVETEPNSGIVSDTHEGLPLGIFLRETELTRPTPELVALGARARALSDGTTLDWAHKLNNLVNETIRFRTGATTVTTAAAAALAAGEGVCQDLSHVFLAAARSNGLPARYVSGYQFAEGRARDEHASHAWAEAFVEGLGWVGFDPSGGVSTTDAHVRIAVGLDYLGAAPVRGAVYGGGGETLEVLVRMERAVGPSRSAAGQSQSQSVQ